MLNEKELILRVKANDTDAFEILYNRYFNRLLAFLRSLRLDQNIDDVIQETFIKIWDTRHSLDPEKSFNAYLFSIARNFALKDLKQTLRNRIEIETLHDLADFDSIDDVLAASEREERLLKLIEQLPERPRTILKLKRFEGLTVEQISQRLGIKPKTVENHINTALSILRKSALYYFLIFPFLK